MAGTARHEGSKPFALQSGNQSGSRWGLRGIEDLGGGLKGIFTLESGFNVDDGKMGQSGACLDAPRMLACKTSGGG
jgi:predicted porin